MAIVRWFRAEDAAALAAMNEKFNGVKASEADVRQRWKQAADAEMVCVAELRGEVIAFACAQVVRSVCYPGPYGEMSEMYVEEPHRGRGVGRKMAEFLEAELVARGVTEIRAVTSERNDRCQALCADEGYQRKSNTVFAKAFGARGVREARHEGF